MHKYPIIHADERFCNENLWVLSAVMLQQYTDFVFTAYCHCTTANFQKRFKRMHKNTQCSQYCLR